MRTITTVAAALLFVFPIAAGCSSAREEANVPGEEEIGEEGAVATGESALATCYCAAPYTCGHSTSPSYMYPAAYAAIKRAGVTDSQLTQTYGDAEASVGTHCPEPGTSYSAATDVTSTSAPCTRVHRLRMEGFAAWSRVPPTFSAHIHAVYAGTPVLKQSLKNQISSFYQKRNGLANNAIDTICPITDAEITAVRNVQNGGGGTTDCVAGGAYCGGDRVVGDANTLYRCNSDGKSATQIRACSHGCYVAPAGQDDRCRCVAGSAYCGGDVVDGDANTLYRCGSDGVSISVIQVCANGCQWNTGDDDACK
ncbi:hypothetical protein LVJ94_08565 [Pendulispora rubella]|uniref:Uncharacterized protein n=1 Tax=Pendulispora rubella TaxID=2741070 RepID=A0ABZ2LBJ4_9BACT